MCEVDLGKGAIAVGGEPSDKEPEVGSLLQRLLQVSNAADGQMQRGAGRSFQRGGGQTGGLAFGHDESLGTERVGGAYDGTEVVRILNLVEKD